MQTFDCIAPRGSPKTERIEGLGGTKTHRHSIFKMQSNRSDFPDEDIFDGHPANLKSQRHSIGMFNKYRLKPRSQSLGAAALQSSGISQIASIVRQRDADSDSEMDTSLRNIPNRPDSFKYAKSLMIISSQ